MVYEIIRTLLYYVSIREKYEKQMHYIITTLSAECLKDFDKANHNTSYIRYEIQI